MVNHRLKQPDWLSLYPRDTDASLLTDIVLSHARDRLAELRVSDAATDSAPMELVRFDDVEDVVVNGAPPIPPIDDDAPTEAQIAHGAECVWGAPSIPSLPRREFKHVDLYTRRVAPTTRAIATLNPHRVFEMPRLVVKTLWHGNPSPSQTPT